VARAFSGDRKKTIEIFKAAIKHKGYALVDIFQPCVTFNKVNTRSWFREHTYYLEDDYDSADRNLAFQRATETGEYPLGIFYQNPTKNTFEENLNVYHMDKKPLYQREFDKEKLKRLVETKR
jgi:2-oxoglutarate ferredoxin oxidoreductase subunit beta